jgi:hypothetical protein
MRYVDTMRIAVFLLAAAGIAAVLLRAFGAVFAMLRGGVESFLAHDLAEIRARRGDLTGLEEAEALRVAARRHRLRAASVFGLWIGLLLVPLLTPWPQGLFAAYALLWLLPRRRTALRRL